jgi:succinate-semialdehyde dehydrogenase/glutarate-semialdehyde dehydrogenase
MVCFGEETFGPVVSLYRFGDEADAVARANQSGYGLNASVYSRDIRRARGIAEQLRCGSVNVNEGYAASFASLDSPMGGMRDSGTGRRQGVEGIRRYTETRTVAVQHGAITAPRWMSQQTYANATVASLRLLKLIGRA